MSFYYFSKINNTWPHHSEGLHCQNVNYNRVETFFLLKIIVLQGFDDQVFGFVTMVNLHCAAHTYHSNHHASNSILLIIFN